MLHWDAVAKGIPSVVVKQNSALRQRFDEYLGYGRHSTQREEDVWDHWQKNRPKVKVAEQGTVIHRRQRSRSRDGTLGEEKGRRGSSIV